MKDNTSDFALITRRASKTFYVASLLYPKEVRADIHILYAFFRISDDMVDSPHVDMPRYEEFKADTRLALAGEVVGNSIVQAFADLIKRRNMDPMLVWQYFASQDIDLHQRSYATYADLSRFIYGVAEVVGLYMAEIMRLHPDSYPYARKLGEAMQLVNIARDVNEDAKAGKCYIPQDELTACGLSGGLTSEYAHANSLQFTKLMHMQLDRAQSYLHESRGGLRYFPREYILPIAVSMSLYEYMIQTIHANPLIVFTKKVRPSTSTLIAAVVSEWLKLISRKM